MIIGIDEVGRGAWAGPLVVGAVCLGKPLLGLKDSKLLKRSEREALSNLIKKSASFVGIGWVSAQEVDDLGLTAATTLACERALEGASDGCEIIIDGNVNYLPHHSNATTLIDGDRLEPAISAASIVAKVARDQFMIEQAKQFPKHCLDLHVGYGTKAHIAAIKENGLTPLHRYSFKPIKDFLDYYEA